MVAPGSEVSQAVLESVCGRERIAVVLSDSDGRIIWANPFAAEEFPGIFREGVSFDAALERFTSPEQGRAEPPGVVNPTADGDLRRAQSGAIYRHLHRPLEVSGPGHTLHTLVNVSHEKKLEQHFLLNLQQLKSMKEIVDILYESLSTPEVINLCLVAVTAQMGFAFNRAFFLQVTGSRLRGRIGIGPSNHEEAHQIWSRLASLNFSSLREVYQNLNRSGGVPDPRTQELALRMDLDLRQSGWNPEGGVELPGILGVLARGKPARVHASDPGTAVDRALFEILARDAIAVVPLFVRGRLAGVIIADNLITGNPISDADLNVLKTFAGYAGVALERSHLYDELRDSVAKLKESNETLRASQQKLLHAEKLSAIGELAACVSHEIRNPLVSIGGLARSLLLDRPHDPETADTLQTIVTDVTRLERFLRDTLDFVKPREVSSLEVDLNDVVRENLATFRSSLGEASIEVEARLLAEPVRCRIDPDLLRHALSNLVKNALEAMPTGGKLLVRVERNEVSATIRVGDTGPGIPLELRGRIFEPFFTTKADGTGLGLAIASQNIRGLGGQLELENDGVYKTVFRLTLPLSLSDDPTIRHPFRPTHMKEAPEINPRSLS
jgi:hypothetical protein